MGWLKIWTIHCSFMWKGDLSIVGMEGMRILLIGVRGNRIIMCLMYSQCSVLKWYSKSFSKSFRSESTLKMHECISINNIEVDQKDLTITGDTYNFKMSNKIPSIEEICMYYYFFTFFSLKKQRKWFKIWCTNVLKN